MESVTEELETTEELASRLKVRPRTVMVWRTQGKGPHFLRLNGLVRYRKRDVDAWLDQQKEQPAMSSKD